MTAQPTSVAWFWSDAAELVWSAYGVSSDIGRLMDRLGGIPLGRIALDEFEMLGETHPDSPTGGNRFGVLRATGRLQRALKPEQHAALGNELRSVIGELHGPWSLPKTRRRSVCRQRLRHYLEQLRAKLSGLAELEHGGELAHQWYYDASWPASRAENDNDRECAR